MKQYNFITNGQRYDVRVDSNFNGVCIYYCNFGNARVIGEGSTFREALNDWMTSNYDSGQVLGEAFNSSKEWEDIEEEYNHLEELEKYEEASILYDNAYSKWYDSLDDDNLFDILKDGGHHYKVDWATVNQEENEEEDEEEEA